MEKEEINLLAPEVKKARLRGIYMGRFRQLWVVFVVGLCVLLLTYVGVGFGLSYLNGALHQVGLGVLSSDEESLGEVRQVNRLLQGSVMYANTHQPWMEQVLQVTQAAPAELTITHLALVPPTAGSGLKAPSLNIEGVSTSRVSIVEFQKILEQLAWVERVESPLKNLASGQRVVFSFKVFRIVEGGEL